MVFLYISVLWFNGCIWEFINVMFLILMFLFCWIMWLFLVNVYDIVICGIFKFWIIWMLVILLLKLVKFVG